MARILPRYAQRLSALTLLLLAGLALLPFTLGWAAAGPEAALGTLFACLLLTWLRPGQAADLPGTIRLAPAQAPGLFALIDSLAHRAGLVEQPEVRIVPGGQTNAAAMLRGRRPVLVVTEALLARLDARRLGAVLAHETAHLAHRDLVLFRLAHLFQGATAVLGAVTLGLAVFTLLFDPAVSLIWGLFAAFAPAASRLLVAALSRTREFAADLGAVRLTGDPEALADALELVEYRPRTWWDWLAGRRTPLPTDPAADAFRTHPPTTERVRRLTRMGQILRLGA